MEEYIYKNSTREKPCTVRLHDNHLEWECGTRKISLNYVNIIDVRLIRRHNFFKTTLVPDIGSSLVITNRFYLPNGEYEDRSHPYNTFVRVLHFHLKQKSNAFFFIGANWQRLVIVLTCFLIGIFLLQYLSIEMNLIADSSIHEWLFGADVALIIGCSAFAAWKYPRSYLPENIPFHVLPH